MHLATSPATGSKWVRGPIGGATSVWGAAACAAWRRETILAEGKSRLAQPSRPSPEGLRNISSSCYNAPVGAGMANGKGATIETFNRRAVWGACL